MPTCYGIECPGCEHCDQELGKDKKLIQEPIFSDDVISLLETLGVNQAGACQIARALYDERSVKEGHYITFRERLGFKYEQAPYDEYI